MWVNSQWYNQYTGDPPYYYPWQQHQPYYQYIISPRQGWQCPGCNACYNPDVQKCWNCGTNSINIQGVTSTITVNSASEDENKVNDGS